MIQFDQISNQYLDSENNIYTPATQFIKKFIPEFEDEEEFWLLFKAVQYCSLIDKPAKIKKYNLQLNQRINIVLFSEEEYKVLIAYALKGCKKNVEKFRNIFSKEQLFTLELATKHIKAHWISENETSKVKGTAIHKWKEDSQFVDKLFTFGDTKLSVVESEVRELEDLELGVYTELRLWNKEFFLAGTPDQIIILPKRKAIIKDWKTNKEFTLINWYQRLKKPVSHLDDSNFNHYSLQLSLYAWILEQYNYEVIHLEVEHFDIKQIGERWEVSNERVYELPYLKEEIKSMLDYAYK